MTLRNWKQQSHLMYQKDLKAQVFVTANTSHRGTLNDFAELEWRISK
jgi:hypothetical protein